MKQSLRIIIEGEDAKTDAQDLLSQSSIEGKLIIDESPNKSIDWGAVIEIINNVGTVVGTLGGSVSLAHTIWKWRKDLKKGKKVVLSKGDGEQEERLLLDETTSKEKIEKFLID